MPTTRGDRCCGFGVFHPTSPLTYTYHRDLLCAHIYTHIHWGEARTGTLHGKEQGLSFLRFAICLPLAPRLRSQLTGPIDGWSHPSLQLPVCLPVAYLGAQGFILLEPHNLIHFHFAFHVSSQFAEFNIGKDQLCKPQVLSSKTVAHYFDCVVL